MDVELEAIEGDAFAPVAANAAALDAAAVLLVAVEPNDAAALVACLFRSRLIQPQHRLCSFLCSFSWPPVAALDLPALAAATADCCMPLPAADTRLVPALPFVLPFALPFAACAAKATGFATAAGLVGRALALALTIAPATTAVVASAFLPLPAVVAALGDKRTQQDDPAEEDLELDELDVDDEDDDAALADTFALAFPFCGLIKTLPAG